MRKLYILLLFFGLIFQSCDKYDDIDLIKTILIEPEHKYTQFEKDILIRINEYRNSIGLDVCIISNTVSKIAKTHTQYMIDNVVFNHNNYIERKNSLKLIGATADGENIGFGWGTPAGFVNAWIKSERHGIIISSSKYTHFGISVLKDSIGRNYATQIFIRLE